MGASTISIDDLTPEQRRELGVRLPRQTVFSKDDVRTWALKCLAPLAVLSRIERKRVLQHALKVNAI